MTNKYNTRRTNSENTTRK